MGAEAPGNFSPTYRPDALTTEELDRLGREGIEVSFEEITPLEDGTLGYKNSRVLVYIRDVSSYGGQFELPKFHVSYCRKLREMKENNRIERYVVATKEDGTFPINKIDRGRKAGSYTPKLNVCQHCLNKLHFDNFELGLNKQTRITIVHEFTISRFFELYPKSLHIVQPTYSDVTAPVNEYSPGFSEAASNYKHNQFWKCEKCNLDFSNGSDRRFLHVHHLNGQKYDDNRLNHRALCFGCHAEQPYHGHMKRTDAYKDFLRLYGRRWTAAVQQK